MKTKQIDLSLLDALGRVGDARKLFKWTDGEPDYVVDLGLGPEHIPALVELARQWVDLDDEADGDELWSPVHAWRALGQLRAVEAVEPLLAMQNALSRRHDDWYLEEFHEVFGMVGPPAIEALAAYLVDQANAESPRISAANGLCEIALRFSETREQVVKILTDDLARQAQGLGSYNGFLVSYLLDLRAAESAEVIERAYAAGVVDPWICGPWSKVRRELRVDGLGLVAEKDEPKPKPLLPPGLIERLNRTTENQRNRVRKRKVKAKRKQSRKSGK